MPPLAAAVPWRQNHLSEFPRVSRGSVGFRYNYPFFDTPACFDPHFLRIHRLNSKVRPLVCLSVRSSPPKSVLPLPPPKHARSLGACPLSCCNGATRSVGHSFYRFFCDGRPFAPPSARWRPRNEMPEGLIAFCLAAG